MYNAILDELLPLAPGATRAERLRALEPFLPGRHGAPRDRAALITPAAFDETLARDTSQWSRVHHLEARQAPLAEVGTPNDDAIRYALKKAQERAAAHIEALQLKVARESEAAAAGSSSSPPA
jgi:hypothetical protein